MVLTDLVRHFGMDHTKQIPVDLEMESHNIHIGFIRGFINSDSCAIKSRAKIELSQSDFPRLQATQRMLLRLGINSYIKKVNDEGKRFCVSQVCDTKSEYKLYITKSNINTFIERIKYNHKNKQTILQTSSDRRKRIYPEHFTCRFKSKTYTRTATAYTINTNMIDVSSFVCLFNS